MTSQGGGTKKFFQEKKRDNLWPEKFFLSERTLRGAEKGAPHPCRSGACGGLIGSMDFLKENRFPGVKNPKIVACGAKKPLSERRLRRA